MNSVFSYILRIKSILKGNRVGSSCAMKYKILIVDDNKLYSLLLNQAFKECNELSVRCVYSGEECLNNLYWNPDVIILDHYLPGIDGVETLKTIKEIKKDLNVIIISEQNDIDIIIEYTNLGIYKYIKKCHGCKPIVNLVNYVKSLKDLVA
jgi:DNA-binding NtrC family response regulator